MTRPDQDVCERSFVEAMVELLPLPLAREPEKRESPDFFLELPDSRTILLEVTEATDIAGRGDLAGMPGTRT
jgi:hypothetical protein